MKKINIKKLNLLVFTLICMFFVTKNVKAADKYVCNYSIYKSNNGYGDYDNYELRFSYENETYSIGSYDINTGTYYDSISSKEGRNGDFYIGTKKISESVLYPFFISDNSLTNLKKFNFSSKKNCPDKLYYYVKYDESTGDNIITYYLNENDIKQYGYPNGNCDNEGTCGITPLNSANSSVTTTESGSSGTFTYCPYADIELYEASAKELFESLNIYEVEKSFTMKFNSSGVYIEDYDDEFYPQSLYATFKSSDLNGKCPNVLYIGEIENGSAPLSLSNFSGNYENKVGLVVSLEDVSDGKSTESDVCDGKTMSIIKMFYNLIRFLVPIIIIVFSVIDFIGIVLSGEAEKMSKAKKKFVIRLIVGIAFLFIPALLEVLLKLAGIIDSGESLADLACKL